MNKIYIKKKLCSMTAFFMALIMALPWFTAFSAEITPYYNNVTTADSYATVSGTGYMVIANNYRGLSGRIDHAVIETKVEKQTLGIFWPDVDGGKWTDTLYQETYTGSHGVQLPERGTYRVTVEFKIYGKDGTKDNIKKEYRIEY